MAQIKNEAITILSVLGGQKLPLHFQKLMAAQAMFESANFTSNVYQKNFNAYGIKMPKVRKSPYIVAVGTGAPASEGYGNYASYKNVGDSALDALHLYRYNGVVPETLTTPAAFAAWLKQKQYYGGDQGAYTAGVSKYYEMMSDIIEPVIVSGLIKKPWYKNWKVWSIALSALAIIYFLFFKKQK